MSRENPDARISYHARLDQPDGVGEDHREGSRSGGTGQVCARAQTHLRRVHSWSSDGRAGKLPLAPFALARVVHEVVQACSDKQNALACKRLREERSAAWRLTPRDSAADEVGREASVQAEEALARSDGAERVRHAPVLALCRARLHLHARLDEIELQ